MSAWIIAVVARAMRCPHLSPFGDHDPYIDGSGNVKVRLRYFITGITTLDDWKAKIDLGVWQYTT